MGAKEEVSVDKLITMEWELMTDLRKMLTDPSLSRSEKIRVANAIAYHSIALNKLLAQKGEESKFNEETLGDFILHYADDRMRRTEETLGSGKKGSQQEDKRQRRNHLNYGTHKENTTTNSWIWHYRAA